MALQSHFTSKLHLVAHPVGNQCNQRNQSMSATTQVSNHVEQYPVPCSDYVDYADYADDIDYAHYANESVSAYWTQIHEPDPPPTGSSLQHLSEAGDLLTEKEDMQGAQEHRVDYADGVINRNQRNQSMSATTQVSDHVGQTSPKWSDYTDYGDDIDYTDYACKRYHKRGSSSKKVSLVAWTRRDCPDRLPSIHSGVAL